MPLHLLENFFGIFKALEKFILVISRAVADKNMQKHPPVVFCKIGFLKILQNLQRNNYVGVFFVIWSCRPEAHDFIKEDTPTQAFSC